MGKGTFKPLPPFLMHSGAYVLHLPSIVHPADPSQFSFLHWSPSWHTVQSTVPNLHLSSPLSGWDSYRGGESQSLPLGRIFTCCSIHSPHLPCHSQRSHSLCLRQEEEKSLCIILLNLSLITRRPETATNAPAIAWGWHCSAVSIACCTSVSTEACEHQWCFLSMIFV